MDFTTRINQRKTQTFWNMPKITHVPKRRRKHMPVYNRTNIPASVGRGTLDPELKAWLPKGPTLGADVTLRRAVAITRCLAKGHGPRLVPSTRSSCPARTGPWQFASTRRPARRALRRGLWCISMVAASPTEHFDEFRGSDAPHRRACRYHHLRHRVLPRSRGEVPGTDR